MSKKNYNKMYDPDAVEHFEDVVEEVAEMIEPEVVEPEPEPEPVIVVGVIECKNKLNLRAEPAADAKVLKELNKGTDVMVYVDESTDDFYKVCTESGLEGYCMKKFVVLQ